MEQRKFFIQITTRNGQLKGHAISTSLEAFETQGDLKLDSEADDNAEHSEVFDELVSSMEAYMNFMPLTLQFAPEMARAIAEHQIAGFAKGHGRKLVEFSSEEVETWELDSTHLSEAWVRHEIINSAGQGVRLLPQVLIIGLISAYDAFLASLLRATFLLHPEIVMTSDKQISFKDLMEFSSMEDAKAELIEREIEAVVRKSHADQFDWMQSYFKVKLKDGLLVWPDFVELCERRNLFTHTGGRVSAQYIKVCSENKVQNRSVAIGDRLAVNADYYRGAAETVYEISLKLCYVFWRKFAVGEEYEADSKYNRRCMELIKGRAYKLAESLLRFSVTVPRVKDELRKMMLINLANALRLQNKTDEAKKILDNEDWSSANDEFKICLASARGDIASVVRQMGSLGDRMAASKYRTWPIFRGIRTTPEFQDKFEEIFGETLISVAADVGNEVVPVLTKQ